MQRFCYILWFTFYLQLTLNAQIIITKSDLAREGENFIMAIDYLNDTDSLSINSKTGIWNFSVLQNDSYDTIRFVKPDITRFGERFPSANLARYYSRYRVDYMHDTLTTTEHVGLIDDYLNIGAAFLIHFEDHLLQLKLPLKLGDMFADTATKNLVSRYDVADGVDSIRCDMEIIESSHVDAYGILITPLGKYETLREKRIIKKNIKGYKYSMFGWTPATEYSQKNIIILYRWWAKSGKIPIAEAETDTRGNLKYIKYQFTEPMQLKFTSKSVSCKGGKNGSVDLNVKGGIPDYTYKWSNNSTNEDISDLKAGSYTVTVTDNKGTKTTGTHTVSEPQLPLKLNLSFSHVLCKYERNGWLEANPAGGVAPYFLVWSNDSTCQRIERLQPGVYGVILRDENRCYVFDSITITEPEEIISAELETFPVKCNGGNDGKIIPHITGGTPPYRILWSTTDTSRVLQNIPAGEYTATITDANNCIKVVKGRVKQPPMPLTLKFTPNSPTCFGGKNGSVDLLAKGGGYPYTYLWSTGDDYKDLRNLEAGSYAVTVTDYNGCAVTDSVKILPPDKILITIEKKQATENNYDGELKATITGGFPPYQIIWSNGQKTPEIKGIPSGNYQISVRDSKMCEEIMSVDL